MLHQSIIVQIAVEKLTKVNVSMIEDPQKDSRFNSITEEFQATDFNRWSLTKN